MGLPLPRLLMLLALWLQSATGLAQSDVLPESAAPASAESSNKTQEASPTADHIMPLEVILNGVNTGTWLLLERNGAMYAPSDAFVEWRVQLPAEARPIDFRLHDQSYWPLSAIPGYSFKVDFASQSAELAFSPEVFAGTRLAREKAARPPVSPVLPSAFLNYDWNYQTTYLDDAPTIKDLGLLTELGLSNSWGVLTSSQAGRNLTNDPMAFNERGWVRLETTFTHDIPEQNRTLRLGDSATRAGMWGRNVYFGGVQFGRNFTLSPGFASQPIPAVTGMSTAPSTVEMYINDVLRQVSSVPTGPFTIDNMPLLTGGGDVRMVVRDILGREVVIEQSFFTSPKLLASGLNDWSVEAGRLREDIGIASNHYGPVFASGTWRHGISNRMTLEGRTELSSELRTLGAGISSVLPLQLLGHAALAISRGYDDEYAQEMDGNHWLAGLEYQRLRSSAAFQAQGASRNFHQLGQAATIDPIKLQLSGNWSYMTKSAGTFGLGMASLSRYDDTRIATVSGNYSKRIGKRNNLNLIASHAINGATGNSVGLYFVMPLDHSRMVSASANNHDGQQDFYLSATQNPSYENNLGWRVLAGRQQDAERAEGGLNYLGRYGRVAGDISASPHQTALRLGATGGLVLADSSLFATQRVDQSYAVTEVADYANIGVGLGGNMLTRTNDEGRALIPRLIPYQNNPIRLDPSELPISAEVDSIEQNAVPAWRSAVKVVFPVTGGRGALLRIILDDGEAAPAGATVQIEGQQEEFYVARRGEVFVTGLESSNVLLLNWKGQQCKLEVTLPPEIPDEITRLGPLPCTGVTR